MKNRMLKVSLYRPSSVLLGQYGSSPNLVGFPLVDVSTYRFNEPCAGVGQDGPPSAIFEAVNRDHESFGRDSP
jgi:hypothetical protein